MYLQGILEVVIGLVFLWLVLSIAAMTIQEWIGNIFNWRAKELEKAIAQMLTSEDLARRFYAHPLIASLHSPPKRPGKKARLPSYIAPNKFGAALFELVIQAGTDDSPLQAFADRVEEQLLAAESPERQAVAREDWEAILETAKRVAASNLGEAAVDSLKQQIQAFAGKYTWAQPDLERVIPQLDAFYDQFVEEQRAAIESGTNISLAMRQFRLGLLALHRVHPPLGETIAALMRQAETYALQGEQAIASTRINLEIWFNDAMDRLSGAYKRRAQFVAFAIGFVLALVFNVDSINAATNLWREPTLRQAIIAQAEAYTAATQVDDGSPPNPLESIPELQQQLQALNIPYGWTSAPFDTGGRQCSLLPLDAQQVWGIPSEDLQGSPICKTINNLPADPYAWLVKLIGMLLTGAAAAQGAPFWFDILKKLVNVRSTGSNPSEKKASG